MRKISIIALFLAFIMIFAGCNLIEVNPERDMLTTVIKVENEEITKQEYLDAFNIIVYSNQLTPEDLTDPNIAQSLMDYATNDVIAQKIIKIKALEYGCFDFTQEEIDEVESEIADTLGYYREISSDTVTNNDANKDLTQEEIDKLIDIEYNDFLENISFDEDAYKEDLFEQKAAQKLYDIITEIPELSESELQKEYNLKAAQQRTGFEDGSLDYESTMASGQTIYYNLGGFRKARQILIGLSEEVKSQISTLHTNDNDQKADEVLEEELLKIETETNDIYAMALEGKDFDELIAEYGDDPGMSEDNFYTLGKDNASFYEEFVDGLFSIENIGDFTKPISTNLGYHIIRYIDKTTEGAVPFEDVKDIIKDEINQQAKQTMYSEQMLEWKDEMKIRIYKSRLK